jgi:positive regulator of sigma E activity
VKSCWAFVIFVAAVLAADAALACPSCASREDPGTNILAVLGAMIAVPYVVAAVALKVVRKLARDP